MKYLKYLIMGLLLTTPLYAADQWDKTSPAGTTQAADLDANLIINNNAQDRLLYNYRYGSAIIPNAVTSVDVLAGELAIPNLAGTIVKYRRNTTTTNVPWASIDTGAEAPSTTYYVYALADADATTFTCKMSVSASAPDGATYYRKLGTFYNNASSNIENVISYRTDNGAKNRDTVKAWVKFDGDSGVINSSFNCSSVTDNGTGDFTVNFTTAFADANYAVVGTIEQTRQTAGVDGGIVEVQGTAGQSASACRIVTGRGLTEALTDYESVYVVFFGD